LKSAGIDDALVEDYSVLPCFFDRFQSFGVGVPFDLVGIVYRDESRFVDDVGLEKVKVQLGLSARVVVESAYLTFHFAFLGFVTVILWTGGKKLDGVVPGFNSLENSPR